MVLFVETKHRYPKCCKTMRSPAPGWLMLTTFVGSLKARYINLYTFLQRCDREGLAIITDWLGSSIDFCGIFQWLRVCIVNQR